MAGLPRSGHLHRAACLAGLAALLAGCGMLAGEDTPPPLTKPVAIAMPAPAMPAVQEAKPEPVKVEAVEPPPPQARFAGHVASYRSLAEAEKAWPILAKDKPIAGGLPPRFVDVDLGGQRGKTVRVLLGGFPERDGAREFCRELRKEGLFCAPHALP
ncbi:SPOR domain-containing protein [Ferrovibrio sp.]|uniref:SPOR domain-containing protein n=1 Tax=Ferrovibrio sp. TaxID=1917215 RepID=UPI0025BF35FE|nr:SPOR domain-containing protein [Ferrovibrio sp.]MBX3456443.1 SPOR domain-containing protein [Ferrovibrio sp.]